MDKPKYGHEFAAFISHRGGAEYTFVWGKVN